MLEVTLFAIIAYMDIYRNVYFILFVHNCTVLSWTDCPCDGG